MNGREKYISQQAEKSRPFFKKSYKGMTSRDDVRDFARSYQGQNYNRVKDLQSQLTNMTPNDPRVQELKSRRRFHNRFGKDMMGDVLGMSPQAAMDDYVDLSRQVRQTNKPVYNKMYPFTGAFLDYTEAGGLPGLVLKAGTDFVENVSDFGKSMFDKKGITGNVDTDEEEMQDYAAQTFGFGSPTFPGSEMTIPYPQQGFPQETNEVIEVYDPKTYDSTAMINYPVLLDDTNPRGEVSSARSGPLLGEDINVPLGYEENILDVLASEDARAFPPPVKEPPISLEIAPPSNIEEPRFNDSLREAGIASMYGQGPMFATNNRRYENEYKNFLANMTDTTRSFAPTYEEFADAYERRYKGKPQMDFSRTMVLR